MEPLKQYWLDKPGNVKKLLIILYVVCALLLLTDVFYHKHAIISLEESFGFYGIYGFVACVILVLVAKEMRRLLGRAEDYYERNDDA
jgi:phage-related holin